MLSVAVSVRGLWDRYFFTRARKVLAASAVVLFILLIRLRIHYSSNQLHGEAANVLHEDYCVESHVNSLENRITAKLIPLGQHSDVDWLPTWAGTGNDRLFLDVTSGTLSMQSDYGLVPVPFSVLRVVGAYMGTVEIPNALAAPLTLVDFDSVVVRQFHRIATAECAVVELTWYAHKTHHNAVVQDIILHNDSPTPVTISLRRFVPSTATLGPGNIISDIIGPNHLAVVASTAAPSNITAFRGSSARIQVVSFVKITNRTKDVEKEKEVEIASMLTNTALQIVVDSHEDLLKTHEHAWSEARRFSVLAVSGLGALDQIIPLAHHYFITALGLTKSLPIKSKQCGCFNGAPRRTLSEWRMPAHAKALSSFVNTVQSSLAVGCCYVHSENELQAVVQSLAQSVAGIEIHDNLLRIAPSWDVPPGGEVRVTGIQFGLHRLTVILHNNDVTLAREDRLSQPLRAIGYDGRLFTLGQKPVILPAETVYIGIDSATLENAHKNDHTKPRPEEHPHSRIPRFLLVLIIIAIVAFHCALGRLVYQEYCR